MFSTVNYWNKNLIGILLFTTTPCCCETCGPKWFCQPQAPNQAAGQHRKENLDLELTELWRVFLFVTLNCKEEKDSSRTLNLISQLQDTKYKMSKANF